MPDATSPSLSTDLRDLRLAKGLDVDDIQQATRVPAHVVRKLEDGSLYGDATFNEVYTRALLKAYAKAVEVPSQEVIHAFEAHQAGTYHGALRTHLGEDVPAPRPVQRQPEAEEDAPPADASPADEDRPAAGVAPAVAALSKEPAPQSGSASGASPSLPKKRVKRPAASGATRSFDKSWGAILGIALVAVVGIVAVLFLLFRGGEDEGLTPVETAAADTAATEQVTDTTEAQTASSEGPQSPRLALPIEVTVLAGGDGLQNFRVTETPEVRRGYWIEPGNTQTFRSDSAIVIWGEGAEGLGPEATLRLQGFEWTPASGAVLTIDRAMGQRLIDSLFAAGNQPVSGAPSGE